MASNSEKVPLWKQRQLAEEKRVAALKLADQQAKLSKLQELGLTGRSPAVDDEALEGVPNPSAIDADTGKTLRRRGGNSKSGALVGPQLVPKTVAKLCIRCTLPFGVERSQFHCHQCGQVLCGECCFQRRKLPALGERALLVCETCIAAASPRSSASASLGLSASGSALALSASASAAAAPAAAAAGDVVQVDEINVSVAPLSDDDDDDDDDEVDANAAAAAAVAQFPPLPAAADQYVEEEAPRLQFPPDIGADVTDVRAHVLKLLQPVGVLNGQAIDGFDVEYEYMAVALRDTLAALDFSSAVSEQNQSKNRYSNILPPEHSRVPLAVREENPFSDYINANFIDGQAENTARRYITCQGPLETTFADFWRMVWEQRSEVVLMLTREVEKGFIKCDRYWPEPGAPQPVWEDDDGAGAAQETAADGSVSVVYGELRVTQLGVEHGDNDEYLVRTFELEHLVEQEKRTVTHIQLLEWPDHGVPVSRETFLRLCDIVDERNPTVGPITVHCFRDSDHQILTDRGFLFLDEVEALVERDAKTGAVVDWRGLRVASYDAAAQQLVYAQPRGLVVNERAVDMIELSSSRAEERRWNGGDDDKSDESGVSVVATTRHAMYARAADSDAFAKVAFEELFAARTASVHFLARAAHGVAGAPSGASAALLELYGLWLAHGARADAHGDAVVELRGECAQLAACAAALDGAVELQRADGSVAVKAPALTALAAHGPAALLTLAGGELRHLARGLGVRGAVTTASVSVRDALVRLLLHAGYSAMFEAAAAAAWCVRYTSVDAACVEPRVAVRGGECSARLLRKCAARSWCFDMGGGFVVVRRARRNDAGAVVRASRPLVLGNCSAGVGRTGTFCAVHSALESFKEQLGRGVTAPAINILKCVMAMRERRPGMVQTKEQYIFAYLAVLERTEQWLFANGLLGGGDDAAAAGAAAAEEEEEQFDAAEPAE